MRLEASAGNTTTGCTWSCLTRSPILGGSPRIRLALIPRRTSDSSCLLCAQPRDLQLDCDAEPHPEKVIISKGSKGEREDEWSSSPYRHWDPEACTGPRSSWIASEQWPESRYLTPNVEFSMNSWGYGRSFGATQDWTVSMCLHHCKHPSPLGLSYGSSRLEGYVLPLMYLKKHQV